mmetsp:Transcript_37602/g.82334  ORF Transcript_37602/g.82334 Transcript_37602/m.82334 type:complete len:560 (+) Transcript_37602:165-1844(+)
MSTLPKENEWHEGNEQDVSRISNCYCPNCEGGNATTVMLPTKVPLFREIIIMTLTCPDCSFRNSEVTFGGEIQERGQRITLSVTSPDDLNRQLVKSDSATFAIPSIEFEIPPTTQRGTISTIEGVLRRAIDNLEKSQPERLRLGDVDNFHRCRAVIEKLRVMAGENSVNSGGEEDNDNNSVQAQFEAYDIILDDPAGNSFIENPYAPESDPQMQYHRYYRTPTQDMALGLQPSKEAVEAGTIDDTNPSHKNVINVKKGGHTVEIDPELHKARRQNDSSLGKLNVPLGRQEAMTFPTTCPHCRRDTETAMCTTDIPHFKEVIIMSLLCEQCGYRSNEIKAGGGVPKFGTKITLSVNEVADLAREVLKSDTAGVDIPQVELKLDEGGLDGLYTTVEGLIRRMHERLSGANPFGTGDAATKQHRSNDGGEFSGMNPNHARYVKFLSKLKDMADGKVLPFCIVINDPLSNSFVGPVPKIAAALALQAEKEGDTVCYANYTDRNIFIEEYTRSHEQNDMLGLNDIKTENYLNDGNSSRSASQGTDIMADLPDRLQRLDPRGPDH